MLKPLRLRGEGEGLPGGWWGCLLSSGTWGRGRAGWDEFPVGTSGWAARRRRWFGWRGWGGCLQTEVGLGSLQSGEGAMGHACGMAVAGWSEETGQGTW